MAFNFDAAERRAREAGLCVVSVCHANLPAGCSSRDQCGNYVKAESVYLGCGPNALERDCAYGVCVSSIHQTVLPGAGEALHVIAKAIQTVDTFGDRHAHFDYFRPSCRGPAELDALDRAWREAEDCARRARHILPAELIAWLATTCD